jgi:hypothetical protein
LIYFPARSLVARQADPHNALENNRTKQAKNQQNTSMLLVSYANDRRRVAAEFSGDGSRACEPVPSNYATTHRLVPEPDSDISSRSDFAPFPHFQ